MLARMLPLCSVLAEYSTQAPMEQLQHGRSCASLVPAATMKIHHDVIFASQASCSLDFVDSMTLDSFGSLCRYSQGLLKSCFGKLLLSMCDDTSPTKKFL